MRVIVAEGLEGSADDLLDKAGLSDGTRSSTEVLEGKHVEVRGGSRENTDFRVCCIRVGACEIERFMERILYLAQNLR